MRLICEACGARPRWAQSEEEDGYLEGTDCPACDEGELVDPAELADEDELSDVEEVPF